VPVRRLFIDGGASYVPASEHVALSDVARREVHHVVSLVDLHDEVRAECHPNRGLVVPLAVEQEHRRLTPDAVAGPVPREREATEPGARPKERVGRQAGQNDSTPARRSG
jgi:hypothetical protein